MEIIFLVTVLIIFYTYFGYPLIILLFSLFIRNQVNRKDFEPRVTFLITAYNEEKGIREKLKNTLELDYPSSKLEIIVASDASSDNTDAIVSEFANQGVKLFRVEGRLGKTEAQNQVLQIATGDVIIFSDATTKYEKSAVRKLVRNYFDKKVGAVSGRYRYYDPKNSLIGAGTVAFWDYENFIKMKQTQIMTITGCCGCIYSVRREVYVPLPSDIISDLVEPLKILEKGYRIVFESEAIAYETTCQNSKEEFKMRVRVISRGMQGILYMKKLLNPFKYGFISFQLISHKILRWLLPFFLLVLFVASANLTNKGLIYKVAFLLQALFYVTASVGFLTDSLPRKTKIFSFPLYFCVVNIASVLALTRTLTKKKDITWETVR